MRNSVKLKPGIWPLLALVFTIALLSLPCAAFADSNYNSNSLHTYSKNRTTEQQSYDNPLWPTHNAQLLAIPESDRWYWAGDKVWTNCTLAGPVKEVYQATESSGQPIFIDVGAAYPATNGFTLVVWSDNYYDFAEMINAVDDGNAWLSVTGYLSEYNGRPQFNSSDGYLEFTWWTNVS